MKSGTVSRGGHTASFEERQGILQVTSTFGTLKAELAGTPAEALAGMILALQIGEAARKSGTTDKAEAARQLQSEWERKWSASVPARWIDRPPPVEVIEAVETGWLPRDGRVVDLGCGTAEIAAWFAERGYRATGIDVARSAVERAAVKHRHLAGSLDFMAVDLCTQTPPDRTFDILIDRGCLHQIPEALIGDYVRNIASIATPGAKMILFMKAFREKRPFGDPEETEESTEMTRRTFAGHFELDRALPTYLNPDNPKDPLPGMAFWLKRTP